MLTLFQEKSRRIVPISGVTAPVFRHVLVYLYTGEATVPADEIVPTLEAAVMYGLRGLARYCEAAIEGTMDITNAVSLYCLADNFHAPALRIATSRFIAANFKFVRGSEDFFALDHDRQAKLSAIANNPPESSGPPDDDSFDAYYARTSATRVATAGGPGDRGSFCYSPPDGEGSSQSASSGSYASFSPERHLGGSPPDISGAGQETAGQTTQETRKSRKRKRAAPM